MTSFHRVSLLTALLIALLSLAQSATAEVNAWLDQNEVGSGESVQLVLERSGNANSQPDLAPLKQDFDILSRSSGSSVQIINGHMSAKSRITLTLAPKHSGKLVVPALHWDGDISPMLPLTVDAGAAGGKPSGSSAGSSSGTSSHVFVTASTEQKSPYVQAAVPVTVRVYTDLPIYQAGLDLQANNDVLVQQLGEDQQGTTIRDGRNFRVIERKYLLFPQRSGKITLDGAVLNAQVQDMRADDPFGGMFGQVPFGGMLGTARTIQVRSEPIVLDVRPRPANAKGQDWLPAKKVTLTESWQPDGSAIHVGDPVTRHLHLEAQGLTAAQLPELGTQMALPDGIRTYPDQSKLTNSTQAGDVVGTRDQDIALVASRPGHYELPAISLFWWDTARDVQHEIDLPARTLEVLPGAGTVTAGTTTPGQSNQAPPPPPLSPPLSQPLAQAEGHPGTTAVPLVTSEPSTPWRAISAGLAGLWLATVGAWLFTRRSGATRTAAPTSPTATTKDSPKAAEARRAFHESCRNNDAPSARRHLLDWARATWPNDPPLGIKRLADRLADPQTGAMLAELDRACYAGGTWQPQALSERLKTLSVEPASGKRAPTGLAELYP
jgi:hypothetical protein